MLILVRNDGVETLDPGGEGQAVTAVLAGDDVVMHRIMLGDPSPQGRMAEALMRATDLSATPIDDLHLALGDMLPDGSAWLALIARDRLAEYLAKLAAEGVEPARLLPAAMLLPAPEGPQASIATANDQQVVRAADYAATLEPALAAHLGAGAKTAPMLAAAIVPAQADSAPNFLWGPFAPRRRWWRERRFQWAAAALVALALLLAAAPAFLDQRQRAAAAAAHDTETIAIAERALGQTFADARIAAAALAKARTAREAGMVSARLSTVAAALVEIPAARVAALRSGADGHVQLTLAGSADAINQLRARMQTSAFETRGQGTDLALGARRNAVAVSDDASAVALARRYNAARDAAILAALPEPSGAPPVLAAALAAAGLEPQPGATRTTATLLPAARPTVLLPVLARLEASGLRFRNIAMRANADQSVRAAMVTAR